MEGTQTHLSLWKLPRATLEYNNHSTIQQQGQLSSVGTRGGKASLAWTKDAGKVSPDLADYFESSSLNRNAAMGEDSHKVQWRGWTQVCAMTQT